MHIVKEILGYKSPRDLFKGEVPAGTLYTKRTEGYYTPSVPIDGNQSLYSIPNEIVEEWESVEKVEPKFKEGEKVYVVQDYISPSFVKTGSLLDTIVTYISPNYIGSHFNEIYPHIVQPLGKETKTVCMDIRKATKKEIKLSEEMEDSAINGFLPLFYKDEVVFGCQHFNLEQLQAYYDLVSREEATFKISANGTDITKEMLKILIKKLKK